MWWKNLRFGALLRVIILTSSPRLTRSDEVVVKVGQGWSRSSTRSDEVDVKVGRRWRRGRVWWASLTTRLGKVDANRGVEVGEMGRVAVTWALRQGDVGDGEVKWARKTADVDDVPRRFQRGFGVWGFLMKPPILFLCAKKRKAVMRPNLDHRACSCCFNHRQTICVRHKSCK
ncbi:hypothetical protein APED_24015 [Acanthopleuribacter pedis]